MSTSQIHRLVLHPCNLHDVPSSWKSIIEALQRAEFLANAWGGGDGKRYLLGEHFVDFITFMGCSPYIALEPPEDGSLDFCHVHFSDIFAEVQFRCASHNVFARCPQCRKRIDGWGEFISRWREDPQSTRVCCDKCGANVSLYDLTWRHTAGFGRMFMDIYSVYPQEGVPTEGLLSLLEAASGSRWGYFYTDR